jgi:glycosyltransferase involved in cell wall biosynthesis
MSTVKPGTSGQNSDWRPLVSVVIPNYNYARFLPQAIDSALSQTYSNVEVIVVDDGSSDGSLDVVHSYEGRVRCFGQRNKGVAEARNLGIRESRGDLVAFLDADDVWVPNKLAEQVPLFEDPGVGMVYCGVQYIDEDGNSLGISTGGLSGKILRELALLRTPGLATGGSSPVVRRECLDRVGLFDVALSTSADWDFLRRIACHYQILMVREPLVLYRQHASAMHRDVGLFERDMIHAFSKMFADPAACEVHALRRRCYGNLYTTIAGSYLYVGDWHSCLAWVIRGITTYPPCLAYCAQLPMRRLLRRLGVAKDPATIS